MFSRVTLITALVAIAEARFGQEQIPISAISAVQGGASGVAPTIAGAAISDLLAATNACDKLQRADEIVQKLGTGADSIAAAIGMVTAEKNFNPFAQSIPTICDDPTLPVTDALRGITPLIDPAVGGSDVANALSNQTAASPLDATGMSVADLLKANGFSNFTSQAASGNPAAGSGLPDASGAAATATAVSGNDQAAASSSVAAVATTSAAAANCGSTDNGNAAATTVASSAAAATTAAAAASSSNGVQQSTIAGLDFGLCVPTIKFEGGLGGRPATEFTFQMIDALAAKGQQEALNPNIITNRMCDQLTNVCQANDAAKSACQTAKTNISALGTRDKSTADAWNSQLGFAGTVTNPDGGDAEPAASATAAARMARSFRA